MNITIDEYLKLKDQFELGNLTTESFHPKSKNLSTLVKNNIDEAIDVLQDIDRDALRVLKLKAKEIYELQSRVQERLSSGHKIFLSGCGATGRLAITIEKIYREMYGNEQVLGFMAGGDYALIRSVESFEDNTEFGKTQLMELGFSSDDLLLSITEGGETSFVIGTAIKAKEISKFKPYFIYCNPDNELARIKRSRIVLECDEIEKLNLTVGPMAISGSTRMQATTVQMLAVGFAILYRHKNYMDFEKKFFEFIESLSQSNLSFLKDFIEQESNQYSHDGIVTYSAPPELAVTVMTDTTERAPTFNLFSFENSPKEQISLSYLVIQNIKNSKDAWFELLSRRPRCLSWDEQDRDISEESVYAFDISVNSIERRNNEKNNSIFEIGFQDGLVSFKLNELYFEQELSQHDLFYTHIWLKLSLNIHSTLVMGLIERYEGNMMTYVKPSNLKLINRASRYIIELLKRDGVFIKDEMEVIKLILENINTVDNPIVLVVKDILFKKYN